MKNWLRHFRGSSLFLAGLIFLHFASVERIAYGGLAYVSDGTNRWSNWDIYWRDLDTGATTRLTTDPAIDNHPEVSPDGQWVVFSSNRGGTGEFDLYLGSITNLEGTLVQLTFDAYPNGPQAAYPDRHPHWHPDGKTIVFSSKNRPLDQPIEVASECSSPIIVIPPRFYEGINLIQVDATGSPTNYVELDIRSAWNSNSFPSIWVPHTGTYVGHPSFNHAGDKLVFSASTDGIGNVWEVYTVDYNPATATLVANSLRRITSGPAVGPNPIQMSAGAHFSEDGAQILFSSTRTPAGNSLIFSVPATSTDVAVTHATPLTSHAGNDYVPEPVGLGEFVVVSDLGTNTICGNPSSIPGATADLDLVLVNSATATRVNLTDNDAADEMLLIGDEVSWFCGLKPNLSACTYLPRIMRGESLWLEQSAWLKLAGFATTTPIPPNLLQRFNYSTQAERLYTLGWLNLGQHMMRHAPATWQQVLGCVQFLNASEFPGLNNEPLLRNWMQMTAPFRNQKFVVASIMYDHGIGAPQLDTVVMRTAARSGNQMEISWPVEMVELSLHSVSNLITPSIWMPISTPPAVERGRNVFTIPTTLPAQFFRLEGRNLPTSP